MANAKQESMCSCGHVHAHGTRCRALVSGSSAGGGGPSYCTCDEHHDVNAGPVPPLPPPVA